MSRHAQSLKHALDMLKQPEYQQYIRAVYLYGSCARQEQRSDSEIDLFLFPDHEIPDQLVRNQVTFHGSGTRINCAFRESMIQESGVILRSKL